ncbi:MAG: hypothetical protein AB7F39_06710 [Variibacter sp.]
MSGRSGYRKTDRKIRHRTAPHEMPDWILRFSLPTAIAAFISPGHSGVMGVTVLKDGRIEARGKDWQWVTQQACSFIGKVANGNELVVSAVLERGDSPPTTSGAPSHGRTERVRELVYVPGASVVLLHPISLKKPLVFKVER